MISMLAIGWEPELRGILVVIIGVAVLMGSIYAILGTNLGARLGFLVALTGLAGWMLLLGIIWMIYGIGLKGPEPSWVEVPGRTVLQSTTALSQAGVLEQRVEVPEEASFTEESDLVAGQFDEEGWVQLDLTDPAAGQAGQAAGEFLEATDVFDAGEFQVTRVFDIGGERWPMIGSFDWLAFFHDPHYAVVEVAPIEVTRDEPGRAAPTAQIDESRQRQYVYMVRDLGSVRQPAFILTAGSAIVFGALCWLLHRRDEFVRRNREAALATT